MGLSSNGATLIGLDVSVVIGLDVGVLIGLDLTVFVSVMFFGGLPLVERVATE